MSRIFPVSLPDLPFRPGDPLRLTLTFKDKTTGDPLDVSGSSFSVLVYGDDEKRRLQLDPIEAFAPSSEISSSSRVEFNWTRTQTAQFRTGLALAIEGRPADVLDESLTWDEFPTVTWDDLDDVMPDVTWEEPENPAFNRTLMTRDLVRSYG